MKFLKKYKSGLIGFFVFAVILISSFFWSGNPTTAPNEYKSSSKDTAVLSDNSIVLSDGVKNKSTANESLKNNPENEPDATNTENKKDIDSDIIVDSSGSVTEIPETKPIEDDNILTCTLSVRCDTVLNNMDSLDKNKHAIIPDDGCIFYQTDVEFYEDESVFNVLVREMKKNKIHLEFVNSPLYGSAYIEGIANIYEYDCGELSGWMYKVNGVFPKYGCSGYKLSDKDVIEWVYSCDLGNDVGGRNGM